MKNKELKVNHILTIVNSAEEAGIEVFMFSSYEEMFNANCVFLDIE